MLLYVEMLIQVGGIHNHTHVNTTHARMTFDPMGGVKLSCDKIAGCGLELAS